jgi:hypothetical protein
MVGQLEVHLMVGQLEVHLMVGQLWCLRELVGTVHTRSLVGHENNLATFLTACWGLSISQEYNSIFQLNRRKDQMKRALEQQQRELAEKRKQFDEDKRLFDEEHQKYMEELEASMR